MAKIAAKRMGRPPGADFPQLLHIRLSGEMLSEIRALAKNRPDRQPTAIVVRELLAEALSHRRTKKST